MLKKQTTMLIPVAPLKEGVLFPGVETELLFTRTLSKEALKFANKSKGLLFITAQKKSQLDQPKPVDLRLVGTLAKVGKITRSGQDVRAHLSAIGRAEVCGWENDDQKKLILAEVKTLTDQVDESEDQLEITKSHVLQSFAQLLNLSGKPQQNADFLNFLHNLSAGQVCDHIANILTASSESKQKILEAVKLSERLRLTLEQIELELRITEVEKDVITKTNEKFEKNMRENILRERLQTIQKELGETADEEELADEYSQKLKKLSTTDDNRNQIEKELKRFRQMSPMNPESGYLRNWLDTVFELPWNKTSRDVLDLKQAEKVLNTSHYGLEEVKDRVLEYIAVLQLRANNKQSQKAPTILCFVGPPGVGKTSIGQAIARALGRKFAKISLGGVRDEAEIRGHRRTYVGAMAGRIIAGLKQAGTKNPVFMLDEIDKMAHDYNGDPSSALLEVLDPSQNQNFEDHYLDMPFDLSQVIFIATANTLDIPEPLLDRMEIIHYSGYTTMEKLVIGKRYLLPVSIKENGLKNSQIKIDDKILTMMIERYTKEAGVRELGRQLDKIMRKTARELLTNKNKKSIKIDQKKLIEYLGAPKYDVTLQNLQDEVGVATGLAWTSVGGDVLFIEVATAPGKGELKLTGKLGDVMKESAQAALTFVRSHAQELNIDCKKLAATDIHLHVPEGAVPKDGPSAGVTIVTALVSALTGRSVKREVAMTGEVTLRGRVLRIGGLKEKAIAAARAGCTTVCIPWENERDLREIPAEIKKQLQFIPVKSVTENLKIALN